MVHINNLKRCYTPELTKIPNNETTTQPVSVVKKRKYVRKQILKVPIVTVPVDTVQNETAIVSDVDELEYDDGFDLVSRTQLNNTFDIIEHCSRLLDEQNIETGEDVIKHHLDQLKDTSSGDRSEEEFIPNYYLNKQLKVSNIEPRTGLRPRKDINYKE